ncbi:unnamed protein product [Musa acuminata subsp. burmannicoides]
MGGQVDIMLRLGHSVAGVIRLNPSPIALLTPVGRRGGAVCFVSGATPEKEERKMDEDEDEEQHADSDNTYQGDAMSHSFGKRTRRAQTGKVLEASTAEILRI